MKRIMAIVLATLLTLGVFAIGASAAGETWTSEKAKYDALVEKIDGTDTAKWRESRKDDLTALKASLAADFAALNPTDPADVARLTALAESGEENYDAIKADLSWLDNIPAFMDWMKIQEWPQFWQTVWRYLCFGWVLGLFV